MLLGKRDAKRTGGIYKNIDRKLIPFCIIPYPFIKSIFHINDKHKSKRIDYRARRQRANIVDFGRTIQGCS